MSTESLVVQTAHGALVGIPGAQPGIRVFKGVPYAAPPVGDLRWRAPQPPSAWDGMRPADQFGPICPQFDPPQGSFYQQEFYLQPEPQAEDCLYLNIWTAARSAEERRPVMVWFHGGAFVEGSGSLPSFHGETLARKGVVLVTVNYRLGVLGYFAHPELSAESAHGVSGNYGLLDQIAALRWVQEHIAAFGGDPQNITIFGQSAGSMSVFLLAVSPLAEGLFQRVIGQSGSPFAMREFHALSGAEEAGAQYTIEWGATSLNELRALPITTLLGDNIQAYRMRNWRPVVDGWALPGAPARLMIEGKQHAQSLLVGATANEWTPTGAYMKISPELFRKQAREQYGELAERLLELYPNESAQEALLAQIMSGTDRLLAGMRIWAELHRQQLPETAYLYYFDRALPGRESEFYGAFHSGDLYYVFDTLDSTERPWEEADRQLADRMSSYWVNFAATGNPNGPGLPEWPAYDPQNPRLMELGARIGAIPPPRAEQLAFFDVEINRWLDTPATARRPPHPSTDRRRLMKIKN
jgi:para-nitrobenzyl esterase